MELSEDTPLQGKLNKLSQSFTYIGLMAALLIFLTSMVVLTIQTGTNPEVGTAKFLSKLVDNAILAFMIVIVAIPEGLPMTVQISLAYSLQNMYDKDKILVRELESNEKMGEVTDFILGKTGTLTTENMSVISYFVQDTMFKNTRKDTLVNCAISHPVLDLIKESIIFNNRCHIEMDENAFYIPVGNGTEVSLLKWLQAAEIPVHSIIKTKETAALKAQLGFNAEDKMSIVAV
jgi:magnesium-transporting ATPase (P-type)